MQKIISEDEHQALRKSASPPFELSVSKIKVFDSCNAKYKYQYIDKLPRKEYEFSIFGNFLHEILEEFHKNILAGDERDFNAIMSEVFKEAYIKYREKITLESKNETREILSQYLKKILDEQASDQLPNVLAVEKKFTVAIDEKILLNGFIDRVQIDPDGMLHVSDYKTTKQKKYLKDDFQLLTYAMVLCLEDKSLEKIRTSYMLLRHNFEHMVHEYTRKEIMGLEQKFVDYADTILKEKLWRTNPTRLCEYCDFVDNCNDGQEYLISIGRLKKKMKFGKAAF